MDMNMDINKYEEFCANNIYGSFMQSSHWQNVKANWLHEYVTITDDNDNIKACALVLIRKLPILNKSMLYAPRGFVCDMHDKKLIERLLSEIKQIAENHNAFLLKIDPLIDQSDNISIDNLISLGFEYHPENVGYDNTQCRENYILDIKNKSCEDVFNSFKPKWRYNIRLATNKGVSCDFYREEKLDDFIFLMKQTGERDGFDIRSKEYFRGILQAFGSNAGLCMCYLNDKPLSGALYINYAGVMSYVYGCSSNEYRNYMPNYLMQWTMIKNSIENNCDKYDFCGIPYWYDKEHKNYGVYRFKKGFNGYVKTYAGEFDYIYDHKIHRLVKLILKLKRKI